MSKIIIALLGVVIGVSGAYFVGMHTSEIADHAMHESVDRDHHDDHVHSHNEVATADGVATPTITLATFADSKDGFNIQLQTTDFEFTPTQVGQEVVQGKGHAHLYVNGKKISRLYSDWYHLPASKLQAGVNIVRVTLNADDHSEWQSEGETIAAEVAVIK